MEWTLVIANMVFTNSSLYQIVFTVPSFLVMETLTNNVSLVNTIFCKFLSMLEKHTGLFIKYNHGYNEKYFYFRIWKLFLSNDQIIWVLKYRIVHIWCQCIFVKKWYPPHFSDFLRNKKNPVAIWRQNVSNSPFQQKDSFKIQR